MTVEQINATKDAIMEIITLIATLIGILWLFLVSNGIFDKRD